VYQHLVSRRQGSIELLTLNRPDVRNAFNEHVIAELTAWAAETRAAVLHDEVRAAVIAGAGKTFCAGADVAWMAKTVTFTEEENARDATAMSRMFAAINELPLPVIGRVHGAALGGGAGLAAVCDIVVAAEDAVFGFTETKLGILPLSDRRAVLGGARPRDRARAQGGAGRGARRGRRHLRDRAPDGRTRRGSGRESADNRSVAAQRRRRDTHHNRCYRRPARLDRGPGRITGLSRKTNGRLVAAPE
jgi:enoyl-CoA hydratase/isomerase-like protein